MADLPFVPADPALTARLMAAFDVEAKIPRALEALGPVAGRQVVLVDGAGGLRVRQLTELGAAEITVVVRPTPLAKAAGGTGPAGATSAAATVSKAPTAARATRKAKAAAGDRPTAESGRPVVVGQPAALGLPTASADVIVACWSAYRPPCPDEVAEADRVLRPGGRLLVVHDYGRDDVSRLRGDLPEYGTWGRRDGWFLKNDFRMRVLHCFWTFESMDDTQAFLVDAFGAIGSELGATLKRPRLTYKVAVYHRWKDGIAPPEQPAEQPAEPLAEPPAEPPAEGAAKPPAGQPTVRRVDRATG